MHKSCKSKEEKYKNDMRKNNMWEEERKYGEGGKENKMEKDWRTSTNK